jgi:hypothetical protein
MQILPNCYVCLLEYSCKMCQKVAWIERI